MSKIQKIKVVPKISEKLEPLLKIAKNMWWVWNFEAIELFRRLDIDLWREVNHNPLKLLGSISQIKLDEAAKSESFLAHVERVEKDLDLQMTRRSWYDENSEGYEDAGIAYFSAEFGIHESLPLYSGGLGILSGDHLKSSSELGLPLYGISLLYRLGYFRQYLNLDGWQQERYPATDFHNIPVNPVMAEDGNQLLISVEYPGRNVFARIWDVKIGRITLFLLDTNIEQNNETDRALTDQLYGGDAEWRIKQELLLGIGGVRALRAMKKNVTVFHMNEGHAAFLAVERIRLAIKENHLSYKESHEFVTSSNVFTTHTPVPAGNDRFTPEMIDKYCAHYYKELGISRENFLALGREKPGDKNESFCMTVLAMKTAAHCNGVAKLHGKVSRGMWRNIWPMLNVDEVPIGHITNGIHTRSWTSDEMIRLYTRYLGPKWIENPADDTIWKNVDNIPDSELWRYRERARERLVAYARKKLKEQLIARGVTPKEAARANSVLNSDSLTVGFARRFATYKRANLILRDLKRLGEILHDREMPMQIVFAGKAHPMDNMGKDFIKQIIHLCRDEHFRDKIVFIEDYDINIARYMVQGVDIWLNTPIRPKEASGTSGMKVLPNGGINISVLDGWWDEAFGPGNGWAIGLGEEYNDREYQDEVESLSLYNILEKEVKPAFYNRGIDGLPLEWLAKIKESIKTLSSVFNTNRMIKDYTERYYKPAHRNFRSYSADNFATSRNISGWKENIIKKWDRVKIVNLIYKNEKDVTVGSKVNVRAEVELGELSEQDVKVELYFGSLNQAEEIIDGAALPMILSDKSDEGNPVYEGQILCLISGQFGVTVRIIPFHENMARKFDPELKIAWA